MSLLLDALKKSEAQRQRGQVPTLTPGAPGDPGAGSAPRRGRWMLVALLLVVALVVTAYFLLPLRSGPDPDPGAPALAGSPELRQPGASGADDSESAASPDLTAARAAPESHSDGAPDGADSDSVAEPSRATPAWAAGPSREVQVAESVTRQEAPTTSAAPGDSAAEIPPEIQQARDRAAMAARVARQARDGVTSPRAPRRGPAPAARDRGVAGTASPPAQAPDETKSPAQSGASEDRADGAIRPWELPEAMRAEFPDLDLTVHFYASSPRDRFVIINGERFGEGDRPAGGVSIGEIRERGVVVDFRNYRVLIE